MRIKAPKPARTFLEMDELVALIDAAGEQDGPLVPALDVSSERADGTRAAVARAVTQGMRSKDIAAALGVSKATVSYHLVRLGVEALREYQGRRAICGTLARSGIRASELCDLRVGEVRLHDPEGARFRIPDAKTEAGVREVHESRHEPALSESDAPRTAPTGEQESSDLQADPGMARPGLEPGTPRFSGSRGRAIRLRERLQISGFKVSASWRCAVGFGRFPAPLDSREGLKSQKTPAGDLLGAMHQLRAPNPGQKDTALQAIRPRRCPA
jgi:hypothetical protein